MKKSTVIKYMLLLLMLTTVVSALFLLNSCAHKHSFGETVILKTPTCISKGLEEAVCPCGVIWENEIPMTDHTNIVWETVIEATCISSGSRNRICGVCNTVIESEDIPALGHNIVKVAAKASTCFEKGYNNHEACTRCSLSSIEYLEMLPHTPGPAADCTNPQSCTVCLTVIAEARGHEARVIPGKAATCTSKGLTDRIECALCQKLIQEHIEIPKREHTPVIIPKVEPTCVHKGRTQGQICAVCEEELVKTVTIPMINHVYTDDSDATCEICKSARILGCKHEEQIPTGNISPTCTKQGLSAGIACANTRCDWIIDNPEVLQEEEHTPALIVGYRSTETKPGLTNGIYCALCFTILKEQAIIPAGDSTSPDTVTLESWTVGGESESTVLDFNKKIIESIKEKSYKVTSTKKTTTSFDYGGKSTESATSTYIFDKGNWSTSLTIENRDVNAIFFDGVLYVTSENDDGSIAKKKLSAPNDGDFKAYLGLDFKNTVLTAFKKVNFENDGNGNTIFNCSKPKKDKDSLIARILRELENMGNVYLNDSKTSATLTVINDNDILNQYSAVLASVETEFLGKLEITVETTDVYNYGNYTVSAPEDADSYKEAKSFADLFN